MPALGLEGALLEDDVAVKAAFSGGDDRIRGVCALIEGEPLESRDVREFRARLRDDDIPELIRDGVRELPLGRPLA